jgi:hypothetical protein
MFAENAGFPLSYRLEYLRHYLHSGDLLVLPLELETYFRDFEANRRFIDGVMKSPHYLIGYYAHFSVRQRVQFIFQSVPVDSVRRSVEEKLFSKEKSNLFERYALEAVTAGDERKRGGGLMRQAREVGLRDECDEFLLSPSERVRLERGRLGSGFRRSLSLLRDLQRAGVNVAFTWPAIVDAPLSPCLRSRQIVSSLSSLPGLIQREGFEFVGELSASHFESSCFLNTYYHIAMECADRRTKHLVEALQGTVLRDQSYAFDSDGLDDFVGSALAKRLFVTPESDGWVSGSNLRKVARAGRGVKLSDGRLRVRRAKSSFFLYLNKPNDKGSYRVTLAGQFRDGFSTGTVEVKGCQVKRRLKQRTRLNIPVSCARSGIVRIDLEMSRSRERTVAAGDGPPKVSYVLSKLKIG